MCLQLGEKALPIIQPLSDALGIEVSGVDLTRPISERDFQAIFEAWIEATVLLFRGQSLTPTNQLEFARRFGPLLNYASASNMHENFPEILILSNLKKGKQPLGSPISGRYWHTDGHYLKEPPSASVLYAIETPDNGGDTWFSNMFAAYEALPSEMKAELEGLEVVISRVQSRPYNYPDRPPPTDIQKADWPDMPHPLVRTHPISGRKALYVGGNVPWRIVGMDDSKSAPLITYLQTFATQKLFTYKHEWAPGDLVVWDNRSSMHRATSYNEQKDRRLMHRVTVKGDKPY